MKYTSRKGTVINIPDGLTPKQIKDIKADADAGYGTRAQETANKLGKQVNKAPEAPKTIEEQIARTQAEIDKRKGNAPNYQARLEELQRQQAAASSAPSPTSGIVGESTISPGVVDPGTGTIDPIKASKDVDEAEKKDIETNFELNQPRRITDQFGNVRIITRDPNTGEVTITEETGGTANKFKSLAEAAASTFNGDVSRQKAEEATYGTLTKFYERDRARELEDAKQEMANRGIPYNPAAANDPNTQDLYGRTIGSVDQKYRSLKDDASRQAILAGNQAYAVDASARDSFLNSVLSGASTFGGRWTPYQNNIMTDSSGDTKDILSMSAQQYANKYGISVQEALAKRKDATDRMAISAANRRGGGGGSGGGAPGAGFEIIG